MGPRIDADAADFFEERDSALCAPLSGGIHCFASVKFA